ncbi:MAG: DUF2891 family protein, partial [Gammaproteobacteria bacterium]
MPRPGRTSSRSDTCRCSRATAMPPLDEELAARLAAIACAALAREYPNHLTHFLNGDADARTPRSLHPAFYGALDW